MRFFVLALTVLLSSGLFAGTIADNFNTRAYNNNDGTDNWTSNWQESGDDNSATSGDIQITGNRLRLKDDSRSISRSMDLSVYDTVTLSFDYQESSFDGPWDYVNVQIYNAGSWFNLQTFSGSSVGSGSTSIDISSYRSSTNQIRFQTSPFLGNNDIFRVDNLLIDGSIPPASSPYFAISHSGTGATCTPQAITITARDINHNVNTSYLGNIVVVAYEGGTASGEWTLLDGNNTGSFEFYNDPGANQVFARYSFVASDNGEIQLGFESETSGTFNFNVSDGAINEPSTEDPDLVVTSAVALVGNMRDEFDGSSGTFKDEFEVASYSNSDGRINWTTSWVEEEEETGTGAASGDVYINTSQGWLEMTGNNTSGGSFVRSALEREIDLSSYTQATLRFRLRSTSIESNDRSSIAISSDGGSNWTTLQTFQDDVLDWRPFSYDISSYISNQTRIRFRIEDEPGSTCCYGPSDEQLQISDVEIIVDPTGSYSNNNGSQNFSSDWIESDGDGPTTGPVSIYLDSLILHGDNSNLVTIERSMDLSSYSQAQLSFDYEAVGDIDANDQAIIQIFNGSSWINLQTFTGDVNGSADLNISGYISNNTRIRFLIDDPGTGGNCCYDNSGEYFVIDNVNIDLYQESGCAESSSPDHFSISHSGSGINCQAEPVTISAMDASNNILTDYVGSITITTNTGNGDWSNNDGNGTLSSGSGDSGDATYTFVTADNGSVILNLSNTHVETLNVNVQDGSSITENSNNATASDDPDLIFSEAGFAFLYDDGSGGISLDLASQVAFRPLSQDGDALRLRAIQTDPDTGVCLPLFNGDVSVELAVECLDPGSCSNNPNSEMEISGSDIPENNSGSVTSFQNMSLNFDASGTATLSTPVYQDAGRIRLRARYQQAGNNITGSSGDWNSLPAGFCVQATEANANCSSPYASCSAFKAAGSDFDVQVQAQGWVSDGESNNEFCDNGRILPGFTNSVDLSHSLLAPVAGNSGAIDDSSISLSNGSASFTTHWSEMGVLEITAGGNAYLGQTLSSDSSAAIGRFYPNNFELTSVNHGSFGHGHNTPGFTSFTYTGQVEPVSGNGAIGYINLPSLSYQAKNINDLVLENYIGDFFKNPSFGFSVASNQMGADGSTTLTVTSGINNGTNSYNTVNHIHTYTLSGNDHFTFDKNAQALVAPFTNAISLSLTSMTDSDSVATSNLSDTALSRITPTGGQIRYGRLNILPAYGPETEPLIQTLQVEYYNGEDFQLNTDDNSTAYNVTEIDTASWYVIDAPLSSADTTVTGNSTFNQGLGSFNWTAPGVTGTLGFYLDSASWLKYDWSGDGDWLDNPEDQPGQVNFGSFRGHDKIIYWQELQ